MRKRARAFFTNRLLTFSYFGINIMIIKIRYRGFACAKAALPSGVKLNKGMGFEAPH